MVHWPGSVATLQSELELRLRLAMHEFAFAQTRIGRCSVCLLSPSRNAVRAAFFSLRIANLALIRNRFLIKGVTYTYPFYVRPHSFARWEQGPPVPTLASNVVDPRFE